MAYTNDQIKGYADSMLGSGKSWQDVWNTAQQHGVGLEQLTGAYGMNAQQGKQFAQQQGVDLYNRFDPSRATTLEGGGGELFDRENSRLYMPVYSAGRYEGADSYIPGELTGYRGYDWSEGMYGDNKSLNGTAYDQYDATGKKTGRGTFSDLGDAPGWKEALKAAAMLAAVYMGGTALAGAGGAGGTIGGAGMDVAGFEGLTGADVGLTSSGAGGSTFGVVDASAVGSGTGGSGIIGSSGVGGSGLGLKAAAGTGLNLATATGGPGFSVGLGEGLGLANTAGTLGLDATVGGSMLTSGLPTITSAGSMLGPEALSNTYQMADGSVIPQTTSTGVPTPTGGTPAPTPTTTPDPKKIPGLSGLSLSDLAGLLGGVMDYNRQSKSSDAMLDYLKAQQAKVDNLYSPGSAEYDALWNEMSRKDAAAGRNSQYGPRSVDLAARIAQIKADNTVRMTTGIGSLYKNSLDQNASAPAGLMDTIDKLARSTGYSVGDVTKWLQDNVFN
jgi:hypothetical protein